MHYIIRYSKFTDSNTVYEKPLPISGIKPAVKQEWDEKNVSYCSKEEPVKLLSRNFTKNLEQIFNSQRLLDNVLITGKCTTISG